MQHILQCLLPRLQADQEVEVVVQEMDENESLSKTRVVDLVEITALV